MRSILLAAVLGVLAGAQDQVHVKGGPVVTGKVTRVDAGGLVIETGDPAAPRRIAWSDVVPPGVRTGGPVAITLSNGDRLSARILGLQPGVLRVDSALLGPLFLRLETFEAPPPPPPPADAPKTPEQELDAELKVFDAAAWKGRIALAGALRSGNVDSSLFRLDVSAEKLWRVDRFKALGDASYGETDGVQTASAAHAGAKWDHFYSKKFYSYANGEIGFDEITNVDLRALLGIGAGYEFWQDSPDERFGVELGMMVLYESFTDGDSSLSPAARAAAFYKDIWFGKMKFEQTAEILVPLDDAGRYLFRSLTVVSVPIAERLSFRNSLEIQYQGDPPDDTEELDILLLVGIEYTF